MAKYIAEFESERIDKFLARILPDFSRTEIRTFFDQNKVLVNGLAVKASYKLCVNDEVETVDFEKNTPEFAAEDLHFVVLYEDDDLLIIDKPAGVVVHPGDAGSNYSGTVANFMKDKFNGDDSDLRPGIVHRLDKDTSGILVLAKNSKSLEYMASLFKERKVFKSYLTLVAGRLEYPQAVIDSPIERSKDNRKKMTVSKDGKEAVTKYELLKEIVIDSEIYSFLKVQLLTGRTHQIRVHMSAIGHPVVGDVLYGSKKMNKFFVEEFGLSRQFLHAAAIKFTSLSKKEIAVVSELPDDLKNIVT